MMMTYEALSSLVSTWDEVLTLCCRRFGGTNFLHLRGILLRCFPSTSYNIPAEHNNDMTV
jgi:hypothetical protein